MLATVKLELTIRHLGVTSRTTNSLLAVFVLQFYKLFLPNTTKMNLLDRLKNLLYPAIHLIKFIWTFRNMSSEDLLEAVQRELVSAQTLQTIIRTNVRNLDSKFQHLNDLVQKLVDQADGCPICRQPFIQPMKSPCLHVFCRQCITEWLSPGDHTTCPTCRRTVALVDFSPVVVPEHTVTSVQEDAQPAGHGSRTVQRRSHTPSGDPEQAPIRITHQIPVRRLHSQSGRAPRTPVHGPRQVRSPRRESNATNTSTNRSPRPLLAVLRAISRSRPVPAEQGEIRAIFDQAERHNVAIQASQHTPELKSEAVIKWREAFRAKARIVSMSRTEQQKIAGHIDRLRELAQRQRAA